MIQKVTGRGGNKMSHTDLKKHQLKQTAEAWDVTLCSVVLVFG